MPARSIFALVAFAALGVAVNRPTPEAARPAPPPPVVAVAAPVPAPPAVARGLIAPNGGPVDYTLSGRNAVADFRSVSGDRDFGGNGPDITVSVALSLSADGRQLIATLNGTAVETKGGDTRAALAVSMPIFTVDPGNRITAILSPTFSTLRYVDGDRDDDWLCEGVGELRHVNRRLHRPGYGTARCTGPVYAWRVTGDTDGEDLRNPLSQPRVVAAQVQAFFQPIRLRLARAIPKTYWTGIALAVPGETAVAENFDGENGCSASAGHRLLRYYGVAIDYPTLLARIRGRFHSTNILNLGVPPGMLRDALNELLPGFRAERLTSVDDGDLLQANLTVRARLKTRIVALLTAGRPFVALLGWGSRTAYAGYDLPSPTAAATVDAVSWHGLYAPQRDPASFYGLHYVVVSGYNAERDEFTVVDNGRRAAWRTDFLMNLMLFEKGPDVDLALGALAPDVQPATIVYRP